ncbi:MAG: type I-E CRISPR-associated endoribonuclease Cas2e [Thermoplasmata archaeon]|nr:type I-E CRISPR-associated endoribonuclease Cas2e [Thermoplasmata archaeon]
MVEVGTSVYVVDCNARLRDWIWEIVLENIGSGSATLVWSTSRAEFGFDVRTVGDPSRRIEEMDGIKFLVS